VAITAASRHQGGDQREREAREQLREDHALSLRHERERGERRALRPLAGHGEDADDGQQRGGRDDRRVEAVRQRPLAQWPSGQRDHDCDRGEQPGRDERPEAGAGVDHLAQLDGGEAPERRGGREGHGAHAGAPVSVRNTLSRL
jgi:hypothetical protein